MDEIQVIAKEGIAESYAIRLIGALKEYKKIGIFLSKESAEHLRLECYYLPDFVEFGAARFYVNIGMMMRDNLPIPLFKMIVPFVDIESMWWLFVSSIKDNIAEQASLLPIR